MKIKCSDDGCSTRTQPQRDEEATGGGQGLWPGGADMQHATKGVRSNFTSVAGKQMAALIGSADYYFIFFWNKKIGMQKQVSNYLFFC